MGRSKISSLIQTQVLVQSRRRCAFCYGLSHALAPQKGQIAHVDRDPNNNAVENLAWLCLYHHDEYDSRTSQSKGLTAGELVTYRDELYAFNDATRSGIQVDEGKQTLSLEAVALAQYINERSVNGKKLDPQLRIDTLAEQIELTSEETDLALDELLGFQLLELNGTREFVQATNRFFWQTDPFFTENDPAVDALAVAQCILDNGCNTTAMVLLAEQLAWSPRRLNPAATHLVERGYAESISTLGHGPFAMFEIVCTLTTRRLVRDMNIPQR